MVRRVERWHARGHIVFRISPSRFSGSEEKQRIGKEKDEDEKTSGFTSGSCREKAGSLNHAATTTGLQKQTPHLLCCLLPQPTPCCHYVCLYAGLSVHAHTGKRFGKLCVAAEHSNLSNGKADISAGSQLADTAIRRGLICRY